MVVAISFLVFALCLFAVIVAMVLTFGMRGLVLLRVVVRFAFGVLVRRFFLMRGLFLMPVPVLFLTFRPYEHEVLAFHAHNGLGEHSGGGCVAHVDACGNPHAVDEAHLVAGDLGMHGDGLRFALEGTADGEYHGCVILAGQVGEADVDLLLRSLFLRCLLLICPVIPLRH